MAQAPAQEPSLILASAVSPLTTDHCGLPADRSRRFDATSPACVMASPMVLTKECTLEGERAHGVQPPSIRLYEQSDEEQMINMLADFQDCLKEKDPEQRMKREHGFGANYFQLLLEDIARNFGSIVVCAMGRRLIGFSACLLLEPSAYDKLEYIDERIGRITELYVIPEFRGNGVGKRLLQAMENILRAKGCTRVELGVMRWNTEAHALYAKLGYGEHYVRMAKPL